MISPSQILGKAERLARDKRSSLFYHFDQASFFNHVKYLRLRLEGYPSEPPFIYKYLPGSIILAYFTSHTLQDISVRPNIFE